MFEREREREGEGVSERGREREGEGGRQKEREREIERETPGGGRPRWRTARFGEGTRARILPPPRIKSFSLPHSFIAILTSPFVHSNWMKFDWALNKTQFGGGV